MTQPLDGKVIIVTGAAGGIGQACAVTLADAGARLVLTDIVNCDATIAAIRRSEKNAIFLKADVGVESDVEGLVDQTVGSDCENVWAARWSVQQCGRRTACNAAA
jgi:NAD(P)-dependent dehydrogenase (short-subunit alcohol dehydrogenase family)